MTEINTGEKLNRGYILRLLRNNLTRSKDATRELVADDLITKIERDRAFFITTIESLQEQLDLQTEPVSDVVQFWVDASATKDMEIAKLESEQKGHLHSLFLKRQEIESQKEEIEKLQKPALHLAYTVLKQKHERDEESFIEHINVLESQIESLKDITELAVKENERLKSLIFRMHEQTGFCSICGNGTHHDPDCEIARLST